MRSRSCDGTNRQHAHHFHIVGPYITPFISSRSLQYCAQPHRSTALIISTSRRALHIASRIIDSHRDVFVSPDSFKYGYCTIFFSIACDSSMPRHVSATAPTLPYNPGQYDPNHLQTCTFPAADPSCDLAAASTCSYSDVTHVHWNELVVPPLFAPALEALQTRPSRCLPSSAVAQIRRLSHRRWHNDSVSLSVYSASHQSHQGRRRPRAQRRPL